MVFPLLLEDPLISEPCPLEESASHQNATRISGQIDGSDRLRVYYVQPAVNCQPSYRWGISDIKPHAVNNSNPTS